MSVDTRHPEYEAAAKSWQRIDNVCDGENVDQYLIELNPHDGTDGNRRRNEQYKGRAVFYAIAGYTSRGLNGLLFAKNPALTVPSGMEYFEENADGAGNSLFQQARLAAKDVIRNGRAGLVTSFPKTDGAVTRQDMIDLRAFATIHHIAPGQIINWRTITDGARTKLSLVVLAELKPVVAEDGFGLDFLEVRRELALQDGVYVEREWHKVERTKDQWEVFDEIFPKDGAGNPWDEIPFTFLGSENNDTTVDHPPMQDLAHINIGHYRNSADYEDSVWYAGQAQPWMSGVGEGHLELMKEDQQYIGSRKLLAVPEGEKFDFAAAPPNPMVKQAMDDKLDLMIGLGARFIQPTGPARTAAEVTGEQEIQHSTLSLISANVSEGYTKALQFAARYMNIEDAEIDFQTTQDFVSSDAKAEDLKQVSADWALGAMPTSDMIRWKQRRGVIDPEKSVEEVMEELSGG